MLPFKKDDAVTGPMETVRRNPDNEREHDFLYGIAEELISAVHSKNVDSLVDCLRAAFELMDSEPHEEGPHV